MNAMLAPIESDDNDAGLASTLTEKQAAFAVAYVENGGNAKTAAEIAGYSDPRTDGYRLSRLPHVMAAVRAETSRAITRGATLSIRFMTKALEEDSKLSGAVKFQCAKWLAEAAGHGARAAAPERDDKPQGEMSLADLDAFVSAGREALKRARADREAIPGEARDVTREEEARKSLQAQGIEPS